MGRQVGIHPQKPHGSLITGNLRWRTRIYSQMHKTGTQIQDAEVRVEARALRSRVAKALGRSHPRLGVGGLSHKQKKCGP